MATQMMRPLRIPRDTRLIEFASGWALLLTALLLPAETLSADLLQASPGLGWVVFLGLTGVLHLVTVYLMEEIEMLRAALCFVSGTFWIWVAMMGLRDPHIEDFAVFALGVGCLMAFLVNSLAVRWTWNH
jgi:hypothetical protein